MYRNGVWLLTDVHQRNAPITHRVHFNPFGTLAGVAIAGDWNSDAHDSVGLYFNGSFRLLNNLTGTPLISNFVFGPAEAGWIPLVGDWNGDGRDTIGIYREGLWRLRNSNNTGSADIGFTFRGNGHPVASYRGGVMAVAALAQAPRPTATPIEIDVASPTATATIMPEITVPAEPSAEVTIEIPPTLEPTETAVLPTVTPMPTATETIPTATLTPSATLAPVEVTPEVTQTE
jgi:hypothetical protein